MKLLYCPVCDDVVGLIGMEWRMCLCHRSGGQYNPDNLTATIGGIGKVFGVPNPFFSEAYMAGPDVIASLRNKYEQWSTDIWWGEYKGDWQLIRVKNPCGGIPTDWEKRVSKLKNKGGVKGYEGRTEIENQLREKYRGKALIRNMWNNKLNRHLWNRWGKKSKDEIISELLERNAQLEDKIVSLNGRIERLEVIDASKSKS